MSTPCAQLTRRAAGWPPSQSGPVAPTSGRLDFVFLNILRWNDLTQRPHHFASGLAKRGYRVFWVDVKLIPAERFTGTAIPRKLMDNVFEIQLPGFAGDIYHFSWRPAVLELMIGALDQLRRASGIGQAVQLVNFPSWTPLAQRARQHFGWPIVYDCLDDQYAFSELHGHRGAAYEAELTQTCDVLVTSGHELYKAKLIHRKDAILILNAVDYWHLQRRRFSGTSRSSSPARNRVLRRVCRLAGFGLGGPRQPADFLPGHSSI